MSDKPTNQEEPNLREIELAQSTIEDFDYAVHNWLNESMDIHTTTNRGWKKVPVIWVAGEKVHQAKKDQRLRDTSGALILPLITVERTGLVKDKARKGTAWAMLPENSDYKGGVVTIARRVQQSKSAAYANALHRRPTNSNTPIDFRTSKNPKAIYESITIPMPVYIDVTYSISIRCEYQQQMNDMIQPFITKAGGPNHIIIKHNNHRFEGFIGQDFTSENNVADMGEGAREFQTKIEFKVLGALIGHGPNQEKPKVVIRENAVDVKMMRERVQLQDEAEYTMNKKYRE
jgi:hypothetical protein